MKKTKIVALSVMSITAFFMSGCVSKPTPLYNYQDYSEKYYYEKKELTPESSLALQKAIEEAIQNKNNSRSGRVPPGMYANLGYIYLKARKSQEAVVNFEKEKEIYPESTYFMDRMIQKVKIAEEGNNDE